MIIRYTVGNAQNKETDTDATVPLFDSATTVSTDISGGHFSKAELQKIASMTRCAYTRCINLAGTLAAQVMEEAILRAVSS